MLRPVVAEVLSEAVAMMQQQLEQYVAGLAARELPRVLKASETVAREERESGGAVASGGVVPISVSKTAMQVRGACVGGAAMLGRV